MQEAKWIIHTLTHPCKLLFCLASSLCSKLLLKRTEIVCDVKNMQISDKDNNKHHRIKKNICESRNPLQLAVFFLLFKENIH
jgi:hypothetical protein